MAHVTAFHMAILTLAHPVFAQDPNISMKDEPRHKLLFENDDVFLIDMSIPVDDVSFYHLHDNPTLWVVLSDSPFESQYVDAEWVRRSEQNSLREPGTIVVVDNVSRPPHRIKNIGGTAIRMFAVANKGSGSKLLSIEADDAIELDDNWFRVRRYRLAKDTSSPELLFELPSIVLQVGTGKSDVSVGDHFVGMKTVTGGWSWHEGGQRYRLRNLGNDEVDLVIIQAK